MISVLVVPTFRTGGNGLASSWTVDGPAGAETERTYVLGWLPCVCVGSNPIHSSIPLRAPLDWGIGEG